MSDTPRVTRETKTRRAIDRASKAQRSRHEQAARDRLDKACKLFAAIVDAGDRDPLWVETQEFEAAALELGRLLNDAERTEPT